MIVMHLLSMNLTPDSSHHLVWLICVLLGTLTPDVQSNTVLLQPEEVSLSSNLATQQLSVSWLGGAAMTFDIIILRTEVNETVYYDTVSAAVNQVSGRHLWIWTSVEPLECTSLSVKIRARDGETTSEWSKTQILQGRDLPSNSQFQMYPQDKIVPVGGNTTFCCIVEEGRVFEKIVYNKTNMTVKRLSRRSYATTAFNQGPTGSSGDNVVCHSTANGMSGAVVFVGYPPLLRDFVCETYDLISAVCQWKERNTYLYGKRRTNFSINNRSCSDPQLKCILPQWDGSWTLEAVNPLGHYSLTDSAELSHRVCPVAPVNLNSVAHAWNATLFWEWTHSSYSSLTLVCQVRVTTQGHSATHIFSGVALQSVVLSNLHPIEDYSVQVRCGSQKNFWKWGNWCKAHSFQTKTYVPDSLDVWMWLNRDNTGLVVWKPLTRQQSHGQITNYEVTLWNPEENHRHTKILSPDTYSFPFNLTQIALFRDKNQLKATVIAKNAEGASQPTSVQLHLMDVEPPVFSRIAYTDSGFPLSWQHNANSTCSFLVEWHDASCTRDCTVEWIRMSADSTNVSVQSENFQPGVRYNFSLYSCPSDSPELIQRWQGYMQELVPNRVVNLLATQQDSDVLLTWEEIPLADRRGFILGYKVYIIKGSQLSLLANLSGFGRRDFTVKGLTLGSYKFTVKAYTSAGENTIGDCSINLEPYTDGLILNILPALGAVILLMTVVSFICYNKRKWVKNAFYPDIPEPRLPSDWSRTQGPLYVKPSSHSMVHIVEKPERNSNKDALVVIPEEDEVDEGRGVPVDTDEPQSLCYYNQPVDERPIRPRFPDSLSSTSSMDSANTDVTYTGIQTSCSSLVFQLDPQSSSEGHRLQSNHSVSGSGGGSYRPQMHPKTLDEDSGSTSSEPLLEPQAANSGGYKPQNSWQFNPPTEDDERSNPSPSLGSPISVTSSQFLLPDEEANEEEKQPSSSTATWFSNLLSSSK